MDALYKSLNRNLQSIKYIYIYIKSNSRMHLLTKHYQSLNNTALWDRNGTFLHDGWEKHDSDMNQYILLHKTYCTIAKC